MEAFHSELEALTARVYRDRNPEDVTHLRRIELFGKLLSFSGYATAWIRLNPFSIITIALGMSCRWMILAHHVLHRGYDTYANAPKRYQSTRFGKGAWRWVHWCDWIPVEAWKREHNILHHCRLGESRDPDVPESNLSWLSKLSIPIPLKYFILFLLALVWKWGYYGPSTLQSEARDIKEDPSPYSPLATQTWNPFDKMGRQVWLQSWLPHFVIRFCIFPICFLPLGKSAWVAVMLNTLFAELLTNLHTFLVIVPNHGGGDIPRFTSAPVNNKEHRLRQIVGSVNYRTGSNQIDFLHGWLNYQIEHHLWPDISLRQYQRWQPHLKELCLKHGIPYRQESVWIRLKKMAANVVGNTRMPVIKLLADTGDRIIFSSTE